jgi:beta-lactamase regulating signal transducer with metallopeptidase domain
VSAPLELFAQWLQGALIENSLLILAVWLVQRGLGSAVHPALLQGLWGLVLLRLAAPAALQPWSPAWARIEWPAASPPGFVPDAGREAWLQAAFCVWLAGTLLALTWAVLRQHAHLRGLRAAPQAGSEVLERMAAVAREIGLARTPAVVLGPGAATAYVCGLRQPTLVLPPEQSQWSAEATDHVLRHELTHLRRRDLWWEAAWLVVSIAYWFHPAVHLARRGAHAAREIACDLEVSHAVGPRYRTTLLRAVASAAGLAPRHRVAWRGGHPWGPALTRLEALERWPRPLPRPLAAGLALAFVALAVAAVPARCVPAARVDAAAPWLLDPALRQSQGLGSLHLRFAVLALGAAQATEPPRPND